jgi:hypothetical protein
MLPFGRSHLEAKLESSDNPVNLCRHEEAPMPESSAEFHRRTLAYRVGVLLDIHELEVGSPLQFPEIAARLQEVGVSLSRSRWGSIVSGTSFWVKDPELLRALARVLGEDPSYLLDLKSEVVSDRVLRHMPAVAAKRQEQVLGVAARSLGEIAPQTYAAIARTIQKDLERFAAERRRADGDS